MEREFYGEGGRLVLTDSGRLYGSGWNLTFLYSVDYSEEKAKAAAPVLLAENVISAAAGYNYALYVTDDGTLHFVGDSGIPYKERFSFEGKVREVYAEPDRDVFRLTDENGDRYIFGENRLGEIRPLIYKVHAVLDNQVVTLRDGELVWIYKQDGTECRRIGLLRNYLSFSQRGLLRMRISQTEFYQKLARQYGVHNIELKYVLRSKSEKRHIKSPDWSDDLRRLEHLTSNIPHGPGITDIRKGPYNGIERDYHYSVGLLTTNYYLFRPVKLEETAEPEAAE